MKNRHYLMTLAAFAAISLGPVSAFAEETETPAAAPAKDSSVAVKENSDKSKDAPNIQLALLLDTSSSMDGLINQARAYLWQIVNEMTLARKNGKLPNIRIALYEYGNDRLKNEDNYIRQVMPFTDDLDSISDALFKLTTNGGQEYCGAVIRDAVQKLDWNMADKDALKMIFIAGNEPFSQGPVTPSDAIKAALEKGITVNTVLCGGWGGDEKTWKNGSSLGDGSFVRIDQNKREIDPETPHDKALAELNTQLNSTYVAYGSRQVRAAKKELQESQDMKNHSLSKSAFAQRVKSKANKAAYTNSSWDMVDAIEADKEMSLPEMEEKGLLPEEFKGKSEDEIKKILEQKAKERNELQSQIQDLSKKRELWILEQRKTTDKKGGEKTLNDAVMEALHQQGARKNFDFVKEEKK